MKDLLNGACPFNRCGALVMLRQGDIDLCDYCNDLHFPDDKILAEDQRIKHNNSVSSAHRSSVKKPYSTSLTCTMHCNNDKNPSQGSVSSSQSNYSLNELLCFLNNKMDIMPQYIIHKTIIDFYSETEI